MSPSQQSGWHLKRIAYVLRNQQGKQAFVKENKKKKKKKARKLSVQKKNKYENSLK